jgi:hypothetical protein
MKGLGRVRSVPVMSPLLLLFVVSLPTASERSVVINPSATFATLIDGEPKAGLFLPQRTQVRARPIALIVAGSVSCVVGLAGLIASVAYGFSESSEGGVMAVLLASVGSVLAGSVLILGAISIVVGIVQYVRSGRDLTKPMAFPASGDEPRLVAPTPKQPPVRTTMFELVRF